MGDMAEWYLEQEENTTCMYGYSGRGRQHEYHREPKQIDHSYYHSDFSCHAVLNETEKAYFLDISIMGEHKNCWVAKSLVQALDLHNKTVKVHTRTMHNIFTNASIEHDELVIEF